MKRIIYLFAVLILLVGADQAIAAEISGYVRDNADKKALAGVQVLVKNKNMATTTDKNGFYKINAESGDLLLFSYIGYKTKEVKVPKSNSLNVLLDQGFEVLEEIVVQSYGKNTRVKGQIVGSANMGVRISMPRAMDSETYQDIKENTFLSPLKDPLSTFAVDVDAASYSNVRRMINAGQLPPKDAVRVEEMINYFQYNLNPPTNGDPVKIYTELSVAPWNPEHKLMRIALKAKNMPTEKLPASNFVFLIDVSGSMFGANRLPLVKSSLKLLVDQLRPEDKVAIVTYAGSAGLKLKSTSGSQKMTIKQAIDELEAGGSTAGGAGIKLAYNIAKENFIKDGNNRIVLATDGDFNVGASSDEAMEDLISRERQSGVNLTVLGYGMGNLKDSKMEILANKGHGNYAYIDNISEARKAMVTEFGGTMFTVAKDVKIQVEFNPAYVQAYRLVGYENRLLEAEDFNNDTKLGGDMGVGHTVTALYELIPTGIISQIFGKVDPLKYQKDKQAPAGASNGELATVKFRYKEPTSDRSKLQQQVVSDKAIAIENASEDFRFATAVAEFGMLIRNSDFKQKANFQSLITRAKAAKGKDDEGYRAEFIRMAENSKSLFDTNGFKESE
ncbi:VWA domain-containing protein [Sphingobacterium kyonggiense]|uniref:VWA domain-containing protein n=1 Tax=Sphingobacterium kyonggiense TaxID=714075 RepID=A0ABP7YGK0_9SPHI